MIVLIVFGVRMLTREQVQVRVAPVSYQTLSSTVSTNGKVEPVDDFQAHAPFAGSVKQIFVRVGQNVSKGTLLVRMDDADARARIATANANVSNAANAASDVHSGGTRDERNRFQSDIDSARLELGKAQADLATKQALLSKGAASQAEVDAAKQRVDAANLTLESANKRATQRYAPEDAQNAAAHLSDARAALASAQSNLSNIDVRSPIAGTVYNIPVNQFDWVQFGEDLLDVADLHHLQVRAYFDEPEIGKLAAHQPVKIVWDAKRDQVWHGHVSLAPTSIFTYGTRNVGVCLISIDDPTPDLIPNTNVTVTVTEMERDHVLSVPREALHTDGARNFVFRIVDGKLRESTVTTGVVNNNKAEILSGLKADDVVVLGAKNSLTELTDGLEVKRVQ